MSYVCVSIDLRGAALMPAAQAAQDMDRGGGCEAV